MKLAEVLNVDRTKHLALELQTRLLDTFELDNIELSRDENGTVSLELLNDYYIDVSTENDTDDTSDSIILAHRGKPVPISIGYDDRRQGYQIIANFSDVDSAIEWIETWHKKITGLTEAEISPIDKRVMLYFQTRALEFETGPNFDVDAELINGPHPRLEIRFPDHYDYDIDVTFVTDNGDMKPRIRAVIDDRNDDGGELTYVLLKTPSSVNIFVDGGLLGNGDGSIDCPSWEAAIDFFFREVKQRIDEIFMGDPTLGKPDR